MIPGLIPMLFILLREVCWWMLLLLLCFTAAGTAKSVSSEMPYVQYSMHAYLVLRSCWLEIYVNKSESFPKCQIPLKGSFVARLDTRNLKLKE